MYIKIFILVLALTISSTATADVYKFIDEGGVINFSDTPPRSGAMEIWQQKKPVPVRRYTKLILKNARRYDLDSSLISAVISVESAFDSRAVSRSGAMGLMQLMPLTAEELGVKNAFDPAQNIEGGTRYLNYLINRYEGNLTDALSAYNAGATTVDSGKRLPQETLRYVKKIYALYKGKRNMPSRVKTSTVIYKIVMNDGRVMYTNKLADAISRQSL